MKTRASMPPAVMNDLTVLVRGIATARIISELGARKRGEVNSAF